MSADTRGEPAGPVVVAITADLMDRGRVVAAVPNAVVVRSAEAPGAAELVTADVILLDLSARVAPAEATALGPPVVAYGPHGDTEALQAAKQAGCVEALPRSKVFRRPEQLRDLIARVASGAAKRG